MLLVRPALRLLGSSAICAWLLTASLAAADGVAPKDATPDQLKQATEHFASGKKAYTAKNFEQAVSELQASLDIVNSPNARLELARTLRDGDRPQEAWTEYGRVIQDATTLAATEPRYSSTADAAKNERADIEAKLAFVTVTVANAPDGATLKVGGRDIPQPQWALPIWVYPGAVDVVLSDASGKELARKAVSAVVGQKTPVALDAKPAVVAPLPPSADDKPDFSKPQAAPPPTSSRKGLRPYSYIAGGVGVAGLAVFTIFGVMSSSDYSDLQSSCKNGLCPSSKSGEISNGQTFQTVANVGLVVGIVGVAAGATLFVLSLGGGGGQSANSTALVVNPGYIGLRGTL
jgi:hypothetical protein